ncbi:MAG: site-2 protease family protein [Pseudomonadota bacterium]|nr:site-2 protease family protein [Pseudomonadota bacterium]
MDFPLLQTIALYAVPVVFAITLHEAAHGYVARRFGDQTAWMLGRVTLNPLKHIDPVGTVIVPLGLLLVSAVAGGGGFLFGWAKPVPVNFGNLRHPKRDMLWVAAAGPATNFAMAVVWALVLRVAGSGGLFDSDGLELMARGGIAINLALMVLNLLPILPLDGGRIAVSLLPMSLAGPYSRTEPYGFMLIILLLATGVLDHVMRPLMRIAAIFLASLTGI